MFEQARAHDIDTFCFDKLAPDRPAGSRLLVFWSGHGYTNTGRDRVFLCSDFKDPGLNNRVFNGSMFLRHLRSAPFQCFAETLLLADVCGTYPSISIQDLRAEPPPGQLGYRRQLAFFASPEGNYAYATDGTGIFTDSAVTTLREFNTWPDLKLFATSLDDKLARIGRTPFRLQSFDDEIELPSRMIGTADGTRIFDSVFSTLDQPGLHEPIFRFHYTKTVAKLENPALNRAQGLVGMIRELCSLQDAGSTGAAPRALLEFLVRLTQEPSLAQPVNEWIQMNAANQTTVVATLRAELEDENRARILIVEVHHDAVGAITGFQPYLRTRNLKPLADPALHSRETADWADFEQQISELIADLGEYTIDQIQFVTNPPLFDREFQAMPAPGGGFLGQRYVVVIRYRDRLFWNNPRLTRKWWDYADALRPIDPKALQLLGLPAEAESPSNPKGFCYLNVPMAPLSRAVTGALTGKELLHRQLSTGIPFLCWIHLPEPVSWPDFQKVLRGCLNGARTLDAVPDVFLEERMGGNRFACQATLLWDDPLQNPYK